MTDEDVWILARYGERTPEGAAALSRLAKRLADQIDREIFQKVLEDLAEGHVTVLLIDLAGNKCEMNVQRGVTQVLIALPRQWDVRARTDAVPVYVACPVATFRLTNELSIPPVFRQVPDGT